MAASSSPDEGRFITSKFRGCLLGALLGDCLGSPYEYIHGDPIPSKVQDFFDEKEESEPDEPTLNYTDDTAMTISIAQSFYSRGCLDVKDHAERFVKSYFSDQKRKGEYGGHVRAVFRKLESDKCANPLQPAKEQFGGMGSLGNGGAMRISPVPLFCFTSDHDFMLHVARRVTEITHTHPEGVDGAILQCLAIHQCLKLDPTLGPLNVQSFTEDLITKMRKIEKPVESGAQLYVMKLQSIKTLLAKEGGASLKEAQKTLGNDVRALFSVPIAIYSFLRAQEEIPEVKTDNKFRRTIQLSICMGGDTDTIASMAGAIAGAYFGEEGINKSLILHCEQHDYLLDLADGLYKVTQSLKPNLYSNSCTSSVWKCFSDCSN